MKKILIYILAFVLAVSCFSLFGCGDGKTEGLSSPSSSADADNGESMENGENGATAEETVFTVVFDSDGGTPVASVTVKKNEGGATVEETVTTTVLDNDRGTTNVTVKSGERIAKPNEPYKQKDVGGYSYVYPFLGWYDGETEYDFNKSVTKNLTLTAKWGEGKKFATSQPILPR